MYAKRAYEIAELAELVIKEGERKIKCLLSKIGEKNISKSALYCLKKPSMITLKEDWRLITKSDKQSSK